jgi:hypothetical protein
LGWALRRTEQFSKIPETTDGQDSKKKIRIATEPAIGPNVD